MSVNISKWLFLSILNVEGKFYVPNAKYDHIVIECTFLLEFNFADVNAKVKCRAFAKKFCTHFARRNIRINTSEFMMTTNGSLLVKVINLK